MTLYTADRLAEMLGVQKATVQQLVRAGADSLRAAQAPRTAARPPHRKPTITTGTVTLGRSERRTTMPQTKTAAPVLQHRNGQTKNIITCILPHLARVCKVCANFALLGCGLGALCAVAALAQGGGAAAMAGLAGCLLGGWAAITLREVATCAES